MKKTDKILIELEHWDYKCGDGCCYDYGTSLKLNGETLNHPDETEEERFSNAHLGDEVSLALRAVLKELGYTNIEIIYTDEE